MQSCYSIWSDSHANMGLSVAHLIVIKLIIKQQIQQIQQHISGQVGKFKFKPVATCVLRME